MEHSVEAYLSRQSTEILVMLMQQYSGEEDILGIAEIIRQLLAARGYDFSQNENME